MPAVREMVVLEDFSEGASRKPREDEALVVLAEDKAPDTRRTESG